MSYIRMGQNGSYVDIPDGSQCYIYDNGNDINGWSYGEFAALIAEVVDEIDWGADEGDYGGASGNIKHKFADHFGDYDEDYEGGIPAPERGQIFCQCVDNRIDGIELTDELHEAVKKWAEEEDLMEECQHCGDEFRPVIRGNENTYTCTNESCLKKDRAEKCGVDVSIIEREERIFEHLHYDYDYTLTEASRASMDYLFDKSPEYE